MRNTKTQAKFNNKRTKQNGGITLIALVITIIVLLILAAVSIATLTGENGIITRAMEARDKTEEAAAREEAELADLEDYMNGIVVSENGYNEEFGVNEPNLKSGMIPVYYDDENGVWRKADETNKGAVKWYDYEAKQWANIVTVADEDADLRNATVGTEIPMKKITTFFVWIPRYAYSITEGYKQGSTEETEVTGHIDVTFLRGNTNTGSDNVKYETDYDESLINAGEVTPKIVHPGFTLGNSQITGIWVAKFEASGINSSEEIVGNATSGSSAVKNTTGAYVRVLPSVPSWRHITIGESEYQSMKMSENTDKYGWTSGVNSHLIKNSEWGAVAYLCYSDYGSIPKTNGSGTYGSANGSSWYYNMYTGAGPKEVKEDGTIDEGRYENFTEETHGYNTENGVLSSTTGNVYGVYDMAGGAWERVATYLDNGNDYLDRYGQSMTQEDGATVKYIENGTLNSQYSSLWERYQVSDEEKNNQIQVDGVDKKLSQTELWAWANKTIEYNRARQKLTKANYDNMAKHKGIGVNEVGIEFSYYAPYSSTSGSYNWFKSVKDTSSSGGVEYGRAWNKDYTLIGYASVPFVVRGGACGNGVGAGVLGTNVTGGSAYHSSGFRPVLAF